MQATHAATSQAARDNINGSLASAPIDSLHTAFLSLYATGSATMKPGLQTFCIGSGRFCNHPHIGKMNRPSKTGAFVAALTRGSVKHARPVLVVSWIVAIIAVLVTLHLRLEADFSHLLPPNATAVTQLRQLEKRTRVLADFLVGIESRDPKTRELATVDLRALIESIDKSLISGVTSDQRVLHSYVWDNRFLFAPLADLVAARDALARELEQLSPWSLHLEDTE